jgi:hypothetical protein
MIFNVFTIRWALASVEFKHSAIAFINILYMVFSQIYSMKIEILVVSVRIAVPVAR